MLYKPKNSAHIGIRATRGNQISAGLLLRKKQATPTKTGYSHDRITKRYASKVFPPSNAIPVPINTKYGTHGTKIMHQTTGMLATVVLSGASPLNDFENTAF
jgi:hypothetical protein